MTVDCGISDAAEVAWAQEQGLEVIVTDHHELPRNCPRPWRWSIPSGGARIIPSRDLAGVGVALLLALGVRAESAGRGLVPGASGAQSQGLPGPGGPGHRRGRGPLVGENRILVRQGLKVLEESRRPGLVALKEVAGLEGKPISYRDVVFRLAPRLNAAGRMGQARGALELLLSRDLAQAAAPGPLSQQSQPATAGPGRGGPRQAVALLRAPGYDGTAGLVLAGEGWHPGVLGIVAARLAEEHHRPVAMVSLKEGRGRGSARSIEGFHLFRGLEACRQVLQKFGGHQSAAGFEVAAGNLEALQDGLEQAFEEQVGPEAPRPHPESGRPGGAGGFG